jgi:hypothetical protein
MNFSAIDQAARAMGSMVGPNQAPLVRICFKYWWLAVPAAVAAWVALKKRKDDGELNTFNIMADLGVILTPIIGLITLGEVIVKDYAAASILDTTAKPVTDAQFTVQPGTSGLGSRTRQEQTGA